MAEEIDPKELAEALVCVAKLILIFKKLYWVDAEGIMMDLEDDLSELHQESR